MLLKFSLFFIVTLVALYFVLPQFFIDKEFDEKSAKQAFQSYSFAVTPNVPPATYDGTKYVVGRWSRPFPKINFHEMTIPQRLMQHKEWVWLGVQTNTHLYGMAILQFHYVSHAVFYSYDRKTGLSHKRIIEIPLLSLLPGFGTTQLTDGLVAPGCSTYNVLAKISICYDSKSKHTRVDFKGTFADGVSANMTFDISMEGDMLSTVYPIGPQRVTMTTKAVGLPSTATVDIQGEESVQGVSGLGMIDTSRAEAKRVTIWKWFSATYSVVTADGKTAKVGMQLTAEYYLDLTKGDGTSLESFVLVDGVMTTVDCPVVYSNPDGERKVWTIKAKCIDLEIQYALKDEIPGVVNYGIIKSALYHTWGQADISFKVNGQTYAVKGSAAVLEDHNSMW